MGVRAVRPAVRRALQALCLAALVAAALLVPAAVPGFPAHAGAVTESGFRDMAGHWAAADVSFLAARQVVAGFPDGTFRPGQPVSRGEFLAILARATGIAPADDGALPLPVRPDRHWAVPVVRGLAAAGVVRAGDGNPLDLNAPVTRREVARWVVRARGWEAEAALRPRSTWFKDLAGDPDAAAISAAVARGLMTGYPDRTFRPGAGFTRAEVAAVMARLLDPARRPAAWRDRYTVPVGQSRIQLEVVRVNLLRPGVRPQVVLGEDRVGGVESLQSMAARTRAVAAINGTYFQAYDPNLPREPYGTVIRRGELVHVGADRAAIGFWADGRVRIGVIRPRVGGTAAGGGWYAYGMNHHGRAGYGDDWSVVYTPAHGTDMGINEGISVVVRRGVVERVAAGAVPIPPDGFVVNLGGREQQLAGRFQVGRPATLEISLGPEWEGVQELLQAGPRLVAGGRTALDLAAEGFTEEKITTMALNRSAVALTADGQLLLITTPKATVQELAEALIALGVQDAMCMDSGGSSGLYYGGTLITTPGRLLANALVIVAEE